jgi:hypothetical protein
MFCRLPEMDFESHVITEAFQWQFKQLDILRTEIKKYVFGGPFGNRITSIDTKLGTRSDVAMR